ncbi:MAG: MBL fold metallo-hydrolase [Candidatus Shapirobacteria bacterium]
MEIQKLVVGQLQTNCYLVWGEDKQAIIIDPGDDAEYLENTIRDAGLVPKIILATHGHYDHILAATELKLAYRIPFLIHQDDLPFVFRYKQIKPDGFLKENQKVESFKVVYFGEHSPGSVGFYGQKEKIIFSGDILFADGVGTYVTRQATAKFLELPKDILVLPGHGESFTLADWPQAGFV